uniref:translation initiation factor IF-2-like n=1 Tax=Nyctereutes procyonoides TaxID=34880 RepID=UPI0024447FA9|nr:translation initiation factor IF-2-like [Nyctereutes procyonoides]
MKALPSRGVAGPGRAGTSASAGGGTPKAWRPPAWCSPRPQVAWPGRGRGPMGSSPGGAGAPHLGTQPGPAPHRRCRATSTSRCPVGPRPALGRTRGAQACLTPAESPCRAARGQRQPRRGRCAPPASDPGGQAVPRGHLLTQTSVAGSSRGSVPAPQPAPNRCAARQRVARGRPDNIPPTPPGLADRLDTWWLGGTTEARLGTWRSGGQEVGLDTWGSGGTTRLGWALGAGGHHPTEAPADGCQTQGMTCYGHFAARSPGQWGPPTLSSLHLRQTPAT